MSNRLHFESPHAFEDGATFVFKNDQLIVSVAEELAVDSYNQEFTCTSRLTLEDAKKLRDWLIVHTS